MEHISWKTRFILEKHVPMTAQRYKIYVNGKPVFLTDPKGVAEIGLSPDKNTHILLYVGKRKIIKNYLDKLDKNPDTKAVVLYSPNVEGLWDDFQSCFKILEAAGGLVQSPKGEILVFFRRGSWDMPKGKIDPGETPPQAALREVQEETGLNNLTLGSLIGHTYHTYDQGSQRILKKTWWYHMTAAETDTVPQTEEDIEEIRWVEPKSWLANTPNVYDSIRDVIIDV